MKGNIAEVKKEDLYSFLFWGIIEYVIHCRIGKYGALIKINGFLPWFLRSQVAMPWFFLWLELGERFYEK